MYTVLCINRCCDGVYYPHKLELVRFCIPKSKTMADEDKSWIFDSLVCFLNGPVWNAPLQSFIEEKSLIFEPNNNDNEDYRKIFEEFKNLVDLMLGSFMEDIGITSQQFEEACLGDGSSYLPYQFDQVLFEQIWAANDYEMFKRMMTQRNVELQLQALELIEQKYGITPDSFIPKKKGNKPSMIETKAEIARSSAKEESAKNLEEEIMQEVIQKCNEDTELLNDNSETSSSIKEDTKFLEEKKQKLQEALESTLKINTVIANSAEETKPTTSTVEQPKRRPPPPIENKTIEIDAAELQKRQEYLKSQRDKLVALKKQARKKHLEKEVNPTPEKSVIKRPQSARAAEAILNGNVHNVAEHQQLQIRKALAQRLKAEVVSQK